MIKWEIIKWENRKRLIIMGVVSARWFWQCCMNWAIIHKTSRVPTSDSSAFIYKVFRKSVVPLTLQWCHPPPRERAFCPSPPRANRDFTCTTACLCVRVIVWKPMSVCERERANMGVCVYVCVCGERELILNSLLNVGVGWCVYVWVRDRQRVRVSHTREIDGYLAHLEINWGHLDKFYTDAYACACARERERARQCVGALHTLEIGRILCRTREIGRILAIWDE